MALCVTEGIRIQSVGYKEVWMMGVCVCVCMRISIEVVGVYDHRAEGYELGNGM